MGGPNDALEGVLRRSYGRKGQESLSLDGAPVHRLEAYATLRRRVVAADSRRKLPGWL